LASIAIEAENQYFRGDLNFSANSAKHILLFQVKMEKQLSENANLIIQTLQ